MKLTTIILTILTPFLINGQTYFKDGMKWHTLIFGTHNPYPSGILEEVTLEQSAGNDYLNLYCSTIHDPTEPFVFIKTDGEKVFFKPNDGVTDEWYLLYDFGLSPGEGCYIFTPGVSILPATPLCRYIKCVDIQESPEPGGWSMMQLEEYSDETCSNRAAGHGTWIKGLSSFDGVLSNIYFEADGGGSTLTEVYDNGTIIYSNPLSVLSDATDATSPDIRIEDKDIFVTTDHNCQGSLYSRSGLHIGDYNFSPATTRISVPQPGVYILKADRHVKKIMIGQ